MKAKLPTMWTDRWKSTTARQKLGRGESQRGGEKRWRKSEERKGRQVAKHCVFPSFCGSGGSRSRLAKAAGAELAGQMKDEKPHAVVARSTF